MLTILGKYFNFNIITPSVLSAGIQRLARTESTLHWPIFEGSSSLWNVPLPNYLLLTSVDIRIKLPGSEFWLHHSLTAQLQANSLTSLCLSLILC